MRAENRFFVRAVRRACRSQGIRLTEVAGGWIFSLAKGTFQRLIFGYDLGLNTSVETLLVRDKALTSAVLARANVPCVPHIAFRPSTRTPRPLVIAPRWPGTLECFTRYHKNVVCKPNEGSGGHLVAHTTNIVQLELTAEAIYRHGYSLALSPYRKITQEYRAIVLDGHCEILFSKVPKSTAKGFILHNLATGTVRPVLLSPDDVQHKRVVNLALAAYAAVGGRFLAVDLIQSRQGIEVLEINSGIMLEAFSQVSKRHETIAYDLYRRAVSALFAGA